MIIKTKVAPKELDEEKLTPEAVQEYKRLYQKKSLDLSTGLDFDVAPFIGVFSLDRPKIRLIAVDLETTGLDASVNGIWEIGAVELELEFDNSPVGYQVTILDNFASEVRPFDGCVYDEKAAQYNGYPNASYMIRASRTGRRKHYTEAVVAAAFHSWMLGKAGTPVLAHFADFETSFLRALDRRNETDVLRDGRLSIYCTKQLFSFLKLFGVANPSQSASLDALSKYYSLAPKEGNALSDAIKCALVFAEEVVTLRAAMGILEAISYLNSSPTSALTTSDLLGRHSNFSECLLTIANLVRVAIATQRGACYLLCLNEKETDRAKNKLVFAVIKYPLKISPPKPDSEETAMVFPDPPKCKTLMGIMTFSALGQETQVLKQSSSAAPAGFSGVINAAYEWAKASLTHTSSHKELADISSYAKAYLPSFKAIEGITEDQMEQVLLERQLISKDRVQQIGFLKTLKRLDRESDATESESESEAGDENEQE